MHLIAIAVTCSVLVSVLLKLAPRWQLDLCQMIAANYAVAATLSFVLLPPSATLAVATPWPTLLALGVLLPATFVALAASVRHAGIVRTDVAQRLSLLIALIAAFAWFGQVLTPRLAAGIALGLAALVALIWRGGAGNAPRAGALYPWLVFAGFGAIDVLLKRVAAAGLPLGDSLLRVFTLAFIVALLIVAWRRARGVAVSARSVVAGLLLGALNFANILFYLRAHRALADDPARVFAAMNLGVVALGTLVGLWMFGERLRPLNVAGLVLAVPAILLLAAR